MYILSDREAPTWMSRSPRLTPIHDKSMKVEKGNIVEKIGEVDNARESISATHIKILNYSKCEVGYILEVRFETRFKKFKNIVTKECAKDLMDANRS